MADNELKIEPMEWNSEDEIPKDVEVINVGQQVPKQEPKTISVQECLSNSVQMINQSMPNLLAYDDPALENFAIVIATVRRNMKACIDVLNKVEQANKEAQENGQNNPE